MKKKIFKNRRVLLSVIFVLLLGNIIYSQEIPQNKTVQTQQKTESQKEKNKQKKEESEKVKQVKGSKLDMSKAKGARPPYIVRPTGAGMPVGAGKPGGAIKPGRR
jgi:hypothetical protein